MRKKKIESDSSQMSQVPVMPVAVDRDDNRLLKIDEVAQLLGVSVGHIYHRVSRKAIPVVKLSARCIRFDRRLLLQWIESRSQDIEED